MISPATWSRYPSWLSGLLLLLLLLVLLSPPRLLSRLLLLLLDFLLALRLLLRLLLPLLNDLSGLPVLLLVLSLSPSSTSSLPVSSSTNSSSCAILVVATVISTCPYYRPPTPAGLGGALGCRCSGHCGELPRRQNDCSQQAAAWLSHFNAHSSTGSRCIDCQDDWAVWEAGATWEVNVC